MFPLSSAEERVASPSCAVPNFGAGSCTGTYTHGRLRACSCDSPSVRRTRRPARPAPLFEGVSSPSAGDWDVGRWATVADGGPTTHTGPMPEGSEVSAGRPGAVSPAASPCFLPARGSSRCRGVDRLGRRRSAKSNRHAETGSYGGVASLRDERSPVVSTAQGK
ncbi:hypothetical protein NDU88_002202 [Pleurodeles waltl]|uniref:Uncharacterized protein n=1 Tax=Pleurodeles waltl TaxID=8319 RepID=A0AAV7UBN0_PLEWA|nr:hypothetical protein NDU88_002202 [Pleurodeles waltl]